MKAKPVPVLPCERETTVTYSVEAVRKHGLAQVCTFDPKLKRKVLTSGGRVVREGNTTPPYWCLEVDASLVRITMKRKGAPRKGGKRDVQDRPQGEAPASETPQG